MHGQAVVHPLGLLNVPGGHWELMMARKPLPEPAASEVKDTITMAAMATHTSIHTPDVLVANTPDYGQYPVSTETKEGETKVSTDT